MPQWAMHAPPAFAADAATAAPGRPDDSTDLIGTLHRVAIGATGSAHYPARFEVFEALGRTRTGWNWAAALLTLGWMAYRRLWGAALVYLGVVEGLVLLWFAGLRAWLQPLWSVEAGLGLALLLLSCGIPGLWGDALVYADVRKRTLHALEAAPTLAQARAQLVRQAPTRRRLQALIAIGTALALTLLAAARWQTGTVQPPPARHRTTAPAPAPAPAAAPPATALPATPLPPAASQPPAEPATPPPVTQPVPQPAPRPAPSTVSRAAPMRRATASTPQTLESQLYYINVGVFAEAANAQKVQQRLRGADLPLVVQSVDTNAGERIRVRAGPFAQAQEADAAAERIRGLGLEAVVFRQR